MYSGEFAASALSSPHSPIFPSENQEGHDGDGEGARSLLQVEVREAVQAGRDVFSVSKTPAVERTLTYLQPCYELLDDMYKGESSGDLNVLVLVPSREVANQVREEAETLGEAGAYKAASCFRSVAAPLTSNMKQLEAISTATILIATPDKLKDLLNSGQVDLSQVFYLVLDGADKMVQMGLEPQVRDIIKKVPSKRQSLMFSDSLGFFVKKLSKEILSNPLKLQLSITESPQTERRGVKRPAGSSPAPAGQKSKMILCGSQAGPVAAISPPNDQRSAKNKEKYLATFDLCLVSEAEEIR